MACSTHPDAPATESDLQWRVRQYAEKYTSKGAITAQTIECSACTARYLRQRPGLADYRGPIGNRPKGGAANS